MKPGVGNDVVDLLDPRNARGSRDLRFLKKVLSRHEQDQVLSANDPHRLLWALWAAKEAAYKALAKPGARIAFLPSRFEVSHVRSGTGLVDAPDGQVRVKWESGPDYVHCVAMAGLSPTARVVVCAIKKISENPSGPSHGQSSARARELAIQGLGPYVSGNIQIRRFPGARGLGPPQVFVDGQKSDIDLSLSHDGRFAAYAFVA